MHKLHSKELAAKWVALQTAVPCLHPSHRFAKVVDGPERAVVFHPGGPSSSACSSAAGASAAAKSSAGPSSADTGDSSGDGNSSRLERFLATFPPSAASCSDVAWIVVAHPEQAAAAAATAGAQPAEVASAAGRAAAAGNRGGGHPEASLEERVDAAVEEWERLTGSGRKPTAADVDALAAKHRILKGKWMLFARSGEEADAAWAAVARAVCGVPAPAAAAAAAPRWQQPLGGQAGGQQQEAEELQQDASIGGSQPEQRSQQHALGAAGEQQAQEAWAPPLCRSAKVSSASPDGSWVICLYTDNYQASRAGRNAACAQLQAGWCWRARWSTQPGRHVVVSQVTRPPSRSHCCPHHRTLRP